MPGFGHWQQSVLATLHAAANDSKAPRLTIERLLHVEGPPKGKRQRGGRLGGLASLMELGYIEEREHTTARGTKYRHVVISEKGESYVSRKRDVMRWRAPEKPPEHDEPYIEPIKGQMEISEVLDGA